MSESRRDKELEALKADIARLREDITGLVAGAKNTEGTQASGNHSEEGHEASERKSSIEGEQDHNAWTDLLHSFETSKAQGEKIIKNLTAEVDKHPLASMAAAFGLGYIIAKLWHRGDKQ